MMLFDPLLRVPFFTGLALAVVVALLGAYLRLRDEWLAVFGLAQVAAAGSVLGLLLGVPAAAGATAAATAAALGNSLVRRADNSHHAWIVLLGWSLALLLAAQAHQGSVVAESLLRGQLYFSRGSHLAVALMLVVVTLPLLVWLSPKLLISRFFPDYHRANDQPERLYRGLFAGLVVAATVLATVTLGALPAFALFFMPAWVAFALARGWRQSLWLTVSLALLGYLLAFVLAVALDQPFGPVLVLTLTALAPLRWFARFRGG